MKQTTKRKIREKGLRRNLGKIVEGGIIQTFAEHNKINIFSGELKQDRRGFYVSKEKGDVIFVREQTLIHINYPTGIRIYNY